MFALIFRTFLPTFLDEDKCQANDDTNESGNNDSGNGNYNENGISSVVWICLEIWRMYRSTIWPTQAKIHESFFSPIVSLETDISELRDDLGMDL